MIQASSSPDWMSLFTPAAAHSEKSLIREMFSRLRKGDITSFAGGMPDTQLFPYAHVETALEQILADHKLRVAALNYGPSEGYLPLRKWVATHMQSLGAKCESDNVLMTSGGQQALNLVFKSLISPGDKVVTAAPTYLGALQILRTFDADIIGVPADDEGPMTAHFAAALEQNPKLIYLVSDFSNPSGQTISDSRRRDLIKMSRAKGIPIVDDAAYQQLRFEGDPIEPMIAYDQKVSGGDSDDPLAWGGVIHIGTFSKTMMPGLRVGWIAAPQSFIQAIVPLKQAADLHSPVLNQMITFELVSKIYANHIELLRRTYGRKRDCMIAAMREHLPENITFLEPDGGMFVWVTLPEGSDAAMLLSASMETAKVAFIPGAPFFPQAEDGKRHCRFSFSGGTEEQITDGIKRFGAFISKAT
ncbi:MAG: PLP-dependent aminotransferase family protein [Alphaproteobacteria bacterium]